MRPAPLLPVLIGLVLVPQVGSAQRNRVEHVRRYFDRSHALEVGIVGGPNRSTVTGAGQVDPKIRGSLGGYLSVPIVGSLRLRPELAVAGKQVGYDTETASFTWLEAPLLLEARFHRALGDWTPRFYGGPFVAVRLACSFSAPATTPPTLPSGGPRLVTPCNTDDGSAARYNNGDAGFVVGGALAFGGIGVGARWTRSLVPIAPHQAITGSSRLLGAKHSTLAVTLELGARLH